MRIIRGLYRGKQIVAPRSLPVRPTTDYAKEALFNILENLVGIEEISVLDLFAGTGSISYEFASRGCMDITSVDNHLQCTNFINRTKDMLGIDKLNVVHSDVFRFLRTCGRSFDLVFADPPYVMENIDKLPEIVMRSNVLKDNGLFILEHTKRLTFSHEPAFWQHRNYGGVNFSFFRHPL
ncbi:MAG: RsmD family RNA methyltransferase [Bacteroidales bacterium]|nr:RsmD family RNA methyltransferase [Bacteroidales bacterium]MDZ4204857.1 RsmD family RNA methyltransferase [Bacteroidales bacterium]